MKIAVIGDIHGNKYALKSVLEHIEKKDVDFIVSTGDLVGYMPYPNEVIDLIRKHKIIVVQGNHDKVIAESKKISLEEINNMSAQEIQKNASAAFTNWCISDEHREFLKGLCSKLVLEHADKKVIIAHGSPMRIDEYLYENEDHLEQISEKISEDIIICGHTHIPYFKRINEKYFINAGSVGKPKHGDSRGTYVIAMIEKEMVSCSIEKVEYNVNQIIQDIENNRMISDSLIEMLRQGV
jgi:putative phosphoesterase